MLYLMAEFSHQLKAGSVHGKGLKKIERLQGHGRTAGSRISAGMLEALRKGRICPLLVERSHLWHPGRILDGQQELQSVEVGSLVGQPIGLQNQSLRL